GENFQLDSFFDGLPPGQYTVYIQDSLMCTAQETIEVPVLGEAPTITQIVVQHTRCGLMNGTISIVPNGGLPPYTYSLNGQPFQTDSTFAGLGPGTFTLTVQDAQACTDAQEVEVLPSTPPTIQA
ncbi:SprB repeat-containing protein, partial [Arthrospira platensis SPKY1]|nr:SprB repeat-containing protein [Arthrospira platensis SPKY1]